MLEPSVNNACWSGEDTKIAIASLLLRAKATTSLQHGIMTAIASLPWRCIHASRYIAKSSLLQATIERILRSPSKHESELTMLEPSAGKNEDSDCIATGLEC